MNYLKECDTVSLIGIVILILIGYLIGMNWKSDLEDFEPVTETEETLIRWKQPETEIEEPEIIVAIEPEEQIIVSQPSPDPIIEEPEVTYTKEELETFAHLLYAEAGNCSDECIYAVGSVVLNRVNSKLYPNTLMKVIYQKGQYSPTWHGFMKRKVKNPRCYEIAEDLLINGSVIPEYVLGQSSKSICKNNKGTVWKNIDGVCFWYKRSWKK